MDTQAIAGIVIMLIGISLIFFYRGSAYPFPSLDEFLLPMGVIGLGLGLLEWRVLLMMVGLILCFALFAYGLSVREARYARQFPVFDTPPVSSITRKDGFRHDLHIARIDAGFIIGIRYQTEIDLTPMTLKTYWKDIYPDLESAQNALLEKLPGFISPEWMPDTPIAWTFPHALRETRKNPGN